MKKYKLVAIGNSITNGFPFRRSQSFPSILRELTGYEVINKGNNGETTEQVFLRFEKDVINHKPDFVTILTTTNDFIYDTASPSEAFLYLQKMIEISIENNIRVIFLSPLLTVPSMAQETWKTENITDYEKVNRELLEFSNLTIKYIEELNDERAKYLHLQKAFKIFEEETGQEQVYRDGLHPSILGQEFIARYIYDNFPFNV